MKKLLGFITVLIMINLSLIIGFASSVDFTYDNASDGIEIINPDKETIYSDYLLVSIKIKENINCEFSLLTDVDEEEKQAIEIFTSNGEIEEDTSESEENEKESTLLYGPEKIDKSQEVNFYTIQLEKLVPGKYEIQINVLDNEAKVTDTITKSFNIEEKSMMPEEEQKEETFEKDSESEDEGVIKNIIKNIFD